MDNLVRNYPDVLTPEKCQYFIDKFEAHPDMQEVQNNRDGATLTQINLLQSPDTPFKEDANFLMNVLMENRKLQERRIDRFLFAVAREKWHRTTKDKTIFAGYIR